MEKIPGNDEYILPDIEDFSSKPYYGLLKRIPLEHISKHLVYIEDNGFTDEEATLYIETILERRNEALTESVISDATLLERIRERKEEIFRDLETHVFTNKENLLGFGATARIKFFGISDKETGEVLPLAVKYLVTPTKMTLSASSEHDMLLEVERIQAIEQLEADADLHYIKVPHPYFHHQNSEIQCYGMELIKGFDLSKELKDLADDSTREFLARALAELPEEEVEKEIKTFFNRMHTYCLHGDIKPANLMVDLDGKFYVIDFGQSRLVNDINDKAQDQFYVLCEDEIRDTTQAVKKLIREARTILAEM